MKDLNWRELALVNHTDMIVFLQTPRVKLRSNFAEREVRATVDTGSQRCNVLKATVKASKFPVKESETVIYVPFGGVNSSMQHHSCFDIKKILLFFFEVLDQPVICSKVFHVGN